jgi:hypothetical protein
MPAFFPQLLPEELFYSAVARYGDMVRYPSESALRRDVFGTDRVGVVVVDLPSHIHSFLLRLLPGHGYTTQHLVESATTYPYYRPFLSPDKAQVLEGVLFGFAPAQCC